jgi:pyridoxal phosphate enzyme (YggS family)
VNRSDQEISSSVRENHSRIEEEIAGACHRSGRARTSVALMAVTKGHPVSAIQEAVSLGIRLIGESRVQEFQQKRAQLAEVKMREADLRSALSGTEFHLIGHLQSNKASRAVEIFSSINTLDSCRLAERLNQAAAQLKRRLPVLLEIKLSHEEAKSGVDPHSAELNELLELLPDLDALELRGLMTVPPYNEDLEAVRPYFARLRALRDRLAGSHPRLNFADLSMGMSHDFAVAIEEGSTQIRLGTALFGKRIPKP